jgi:hypothetical protein
MKLVVFGAKYRTSQVELIDIEVIFLAGLVERVELVIVIRIVDVQLVGTNSNNGT